MVVLCVLCTIDGAEAWDIDCTVPACDSLLGELPVGAGVRGTRGEGVVFALDPGAGCLLAGTSPNIHGLRVVPRNLLAVELEDSTTRATPGGGGRPWWWEFMMWVEHCQVPSKMDCRACDGSLYIVRSIGASLE